MKIEVGDYIRTADGIIVKIKNEKEKKLAKIQDVECKNIVKYSKNIIDLIEVRGHS